MTDFFKKRDVRELLKYRKILFIGDSNVRPVYKDLLSAMNQKKLTSIDILKNPDVESYFGDIAVQQCGRKTDWSFWENRIYEGGECRVEMFCTGYIIMDVIRGFYRKLMEVPSSLPNIVFISYGPSHWKTRRLLLFGLMSELKYNFPANTLFIVVTGFPTSTDSFGDPIYDDVPYFTRSNLMDDEENNMAVYDRTLFLGFTHLNLAFYLRKKSAFRGVVGKPGWESVVVRYTTFLLLTTIAQNLQKKTPGRVNQEQLTKAINSSRSKDEFGMMLQTLTNKWVNMKSKASVDDQSDPAVQNAREILNLLWKLYNHHESRCGKTSSGGQRAKLKDQKAKSDRQTLIAVNLLSPKKVNDASGAQSVAAVNEEKQNNVSSEDKKRDEGECDKKGIESDTESLEEGEIRDSPCASASTSPKRGLKNQKVFSEISSSEDEGGDEGNTSHHIPLQTAPPVIQLPRSSYPNQLGNVVFDARSVINLRMHELRQTVRQALGLPTMPYNPQPFTIDISEEESPVNGGRVQESSNQSNEILSWPSAPFDPSRPSTSCNPPQPFTIDISEEGPPPNVDGAIPVYQLTQDILSQPSTSCNPPAPFIIDITDGESPSGGTEEHLVTYQSSEDVIINLDSSDSDDTTNRQIQPETTNHTSPNQHLNITSQIPTIDLRPRSQKKIRKKQTMSDSKTKISEKINRDLYLKDKGGESIPWPTDLGISDSDKLWGWWRSYIHTKNDCAITMCPRDWPEIHARIPTNFKVKGNIAIPKVIDDLKLFLQSLKDVTLIEGLLDFSYDLDDGVLDGANEHVYEPVPLDTGNVQVPQSENVESAVRKPHISVCSFASIHNDLPKQTGTVSRGIESTATKPLDTEISRGCPGKVNFRIPQRGTAKSTVIKPLISVCSFASYRHFVSRQSGAAGGRVLELPPSKQPALEYNAHAKPASPRNQWSPFNSWVPAKSSGNRGRDVQRVDYPQSQRRKRSRSRSRRSPPKRIEAQLPKSYSNVRRRSRSPIWSHRRASSPRRHRSPIKPKNVRS
ncbi:hypothetical protein GE061_009224 [Apolygus lucorum]|uniref:Uncharacterized protein n=1 Tax=Apolygus lucorum TaxID=248454 RepID=A0A6A4KHM1_APOLU|nr:hypothetical protein GE061_009224 [Apolygus lucorum]